MAVVGGGMTGLETAERLVEDGNKVIIVEMMPIVGNGIYFYNVRRTRRQLEAKGAEIKTNTALVEVKDGSIVVKPVQENRPRGYQEHRGRGRRRRGRRAHRPL